MTDHALPPETEALILAVLEQRVREAKTVARAAIGHRYPDGHRVTVRSPLDDGKLGVVYRTDPDPSWRITDRDALVAHLAQDPDNFEYVDDIVGSDDQVREVLALHAPELLARVERVRPELLDAAVADAAAGGVPLPGVERVKPRGVLVVKPDKAAGSVVTRLVEAGLITWDGRRVELPATGDEAVSA